MDNSGPNGWIEVSAAVETNDPGMAGWAKLEVDAVADACAEVEAEERLSSGLQSSVAGWSMQPACAARADAGHKNGPGVARSPSWGILGRVQLENESICRYLVAASLFADAKLRDLDLDRLETQTAVELSQDPKLSKVRTLWSSSVVIGRRWGW